MLLASSQVVDLHNKTNTLASMEVFFIPTYIHVRFGPFMSLDCGRSCD